MIAIFVVVFILFMLMGIPVAFAMGGTALISGIMLWGIEGLPMDILTQRMVTGVNNFTTLAIPLFLLAGKLMNGGTITDRIFNFANGVVGHLPGGLGHVNVLTSVIFSGMSGTAAADAAGPGAMEIKAMTEAGYDKEFAVAVTGSSALIGPIIPPSVPMVMYGVLSGTSVGALFIGGILPGLLMAISMSLLVWYYSVRRNYPRGEQMGFKQFLEGFRHAIFPLLTPVIIIGGIWTGIFTPTEAAGVAVFYALILILFVYRSMSYKGLWILLKSTLVDCASILFLIACVSLYGYVLIRTQIPTKLAGFMFTITNDPLLILIILNIFLLIIGCFMSTMESIILFTPIFLPLLQQAGINLIVFGVLMCLNLMIGQLTPPFGIVLFILTKVSKLPMNRVVAACFPFILPVLLVLILCIFIPQIITFLPSLMA